MGVFTTGGGSFANVGFTVGLILPSFERVFVDLHILSRVRIIYHALGRFVKRADDFIEAAGGIRQRRILI